MTTATEQAKQKVELRNRNRLKMRRWRAANADRLRIKDREYSRRRFYGLEPGEWDKLFAAQGSRCACCGASETAFSWHTDHCHETKQIRGILCQLCNTGIGHLGDNLEGVLKAVDYLRRTEASRSDSQEGKEGSGSHR